MHKGIYYSCIYSSLCIETRMPRCNMAIYCVIHSNILHALFPLKGKMTSQLNHKKKTKKTKLEHDLWQDRDEHLKPNKSQIMAKWEPKLHPQHRFKRKECNVQ